MATATRMVVADNIILYENDFEAPNLDIGASTTDACTFHGTNAKDVNAAYGGQGTHSHGQTSYGSGTFGQIKTVEVNRIDSAMPWKVGGTIVDHYYQTPNTGGKYAIGQEHNDHLTLDFTAPSELEFFNVKVDISQINTAPDCEAGSNRTLRYPEYDLTLWEADAGNGNTECSTACGANEFNKMMRGWNQLETHRIRGNIPEKEWHLNWATREVTFHKGNHQILRIHFRPAPYN